MEMSVVNAVGRDIPNGALTGSETGASSSGTIPLALHGEHGTRSLLTDSLSSGDLEDIQSKAVVDESRVVSSAPPASVQAGTKLTSEDKPAVDSSESTQESSKRSDDVREASSGSLSDAELSGSVLVEETSEGSLAVENGESELPGAFSSSVSRSSQGCKIDHLEQIIEDAKSNKVCFGVFPWCDII